LLKRAGFSVIPFILNPREASLGTAGAAGFSEPEILTMQRTIDPALIKLNDQGYLNGHTPFSALLAFVTLLAARISGAGHIALSNESSASEVTIPGSDVNHQYSKSFEFENDFRTYISTHVCPDINYFSFLRPLNELQIAQIFSAFPQHFDTFKSCNAGSKTNSWCGKCPKCLFVRIILAPFIKEERLIAIFGNEILNDPELIPILNELTGMTDEKPFECVGTIDEVNAALSRLIVDKDTGSLPLLLDYFKKNGRVEEGAFREHLNQFDLQNNLPPIFEKVLKQCIQ
jgi:UDP-N-acetyl-alpha-D-muramoyl-L-alanyl-L-glutamate epimerase